MVRLRFPAELPDKKIRLVILGVTALAATTSITYFVTRSHGSALAPTYDIVLPQRTTIETLGGWQRVSPAGSEPVFAYTDTVDSVAISVSQQPMPASFAGNVASHVKQLADSYSATTVVQAGGTDVYIGRSARGPQSVIFAKKDTLVLIKSQKTISQAEWIKYINNLVDPKTEQTPTF